MLIFHTIPAGTVICSVCSGTLELQDNSLICKSRHCFDIAKQGYVNFLLQAPKEKYDKRLFQSRARVSQAGVFRGLTDRLGEIVRNELERQRGELVQQKVVPPSLGQSPGKGNIPPLRYWMQAAEKAPIYRRWCAIWRARQGASLSPQG